MADAVRILIVFSEIVMRVLDRGAALVRGSSPADRSARYGTRLIRLRGLSAESTLQLLQVTRRVGRRQAVDLLGRWHAHMRHVFHGLDT